MLYLRLEDGEYFDDIHLLFEGEEGSVTLLYVVECWRRWKMLLAIGMVAVAFLASTPQLAWGRVGWW
jgi:hypothetical protein